MHAKHSLRLNTESKSRPRSALFATLGLIASLGLLSACGKQEFVVTEATSAQVSPGYFTIPPKVDILLAQDNSGSAINANAIIKSAMQSLMKTLEAQGWDYRFAVTPLIPAASYSGIDRIAASRQDANWGSQWQAPFPGAEIQFADRVDASRFISPELYDSFIPGYNLSAGSNEPGLASIRSELTRERNLTGQSNKLVRDDALLLVLVLSTGEDKSGVNYRSASNPCPGALRDGDYCNDGSKESSYANHLNYFKGLKVNAMTGQTAPQLVKFYAATLTSNFNTCLGSYGWVGTRYQALARDLGGQSYNICQTGQVQAMVQDAASQLQIQRQAFRTRYLMLDRRPEPSTIQIIKVKANGSREVLAESATNGWTNTDRFFDRLPVIDSPIPMNYRSGWAIELNGAAKLVGDERAEVTFKPYGARDSR
jgi:hypothetical protein